MRAIRLAIVPVLLGVAAVLAKPSDGVAQASQEGPTVSVTAENRASAGAHVYVIQEGHMVPLGFLEPGASGTLTIPTAVVESGEAIELVADLLQTADWYKSEPVTVRPETELVFTIESPVDRSTVSVRD
ncbi:MAG: hypothetical protein R3223_08025 [Longimicrobiales bacterium]|nr:hypothetical protein [Longimicrobiales bacterium]